jgi:hypothetical protein
MTSYDIAVAHPEKAQPTGSRLPLGRYKEQAPRFIAAGLATYLDSSRSGSAACLPQAYPAAARIAATLSAVSWLSGGSFAASASATAITSSIFRHHTTATAPRPASSAY